MSISERTSADIFRLILDQGPLTLYSASKNSRFPLGTIHRHFREMEKEGTIKLFSQNQKGRGQKHYGPTVFGFVFYCRLDKTIKKNLENYFLIWTKFDEFESDLKKEGFDVKDLKKNPKKSKELFKKYVEYGAGVEDQLELIKNDSSELPRGILVFMGEMLLFADHKYRKIWEDLYINLPGTRQAVDKYLENMIDIQQQLRQRMKSQA